MFNNYSKYTYLFILIFSIIYICIFAPIFSIYSNMELTATPNKFYNITTDFAWPVPNSSYISSYFGYRTRPTTGASAYHSGIDIPAPEGSEIIAVMSGTVIYTGFKGSAGCTVIVESNNFITIYAHVSPKYLVNTGQTISKGQVIANIGPKNIYGIINNNYKDSNGNPTNGATTGPHLHLAIKKDGIAVNPLDYISYSSIYL